MNRLGLLVAVSAALAFTANDALARGGGGGGGGRGGGSTGGGRTTVTGHWRTTPSGGRTWVNQHTRRTSGSGFRSQPSFGGRSSAPALVGAGGAIASQGFDANSGSSLAGETFTGADGVQQVSSQGTLPNTGGHPLLMSLCGALVAGSALFFRRKLA